MPEIARVVPVLDADSRPFWEACREHRLVAQRCNGCGRFRWPPAGVCPACHSWQFEWRELDGDGTIASYVVAHRAFDPAFAGSVPYVIAHVALRGTDGAVVMESNLEGVAWEQVRVGMAVRVQYEAVSETLVLPKFCPA